MSEHYERALLAEAREPLKTVSNINLTPTSRKMTAVDSAQYTSVSPKWERSLHVPYRRCEMVNFLSALQDGSGSNAVANKTVLDLATGTGYFARMMALEMGAAHVVGVDVSRAMLDIAEQLVLLQGPGKKMPEVEYEEANVFQAPHLSLRTCAPDSRDIVTASWCLNYAPDRATMRQAWGNIARYLKPGGRGRFVGVIPNTPERFFVPEGERYYGTSYRRVREVEEGWICEITLYFPEEDGGDHQSGHEQQQKQQSKVSFQTYILKEEVYRETAEEAGLVDVRFEKPTLMPSLQGEEDEKYWRGFLQLPNFKIVTAVKK